MPIGKKYLITLKTSPGAGNSIPQNAPPTMTQKKQPLRYTGRDGKILLHCHGGCQTEDILSAMGLTMKDLFPRRKETRNAWQRKAPS